MKKLKPIRPVIETEEDRRNQNTPLDELGDKDRREYFYAVVERMFDDDTMPELDYSQQYHVLARCALLWPGKENVPWMSLAAMCALTLKRAYKAGEFDGLDIGQA